MQNAQRSTLGYIHVRVNGSVGVVRSLVLNFRTALPKPLQGLLQSKQEPLWLRVPLALLSLIIAPVNQIILRPSITLLHECTHSFQRGNMIKYGFQQLYRISTSPCLVSYFAITSYKNLCFLSIRSASPVCLIWSVAYLIKVS